MTQYSDELQGKINQHRNASMLGSPARQNPLVTLANLSPLNWAATNNQASVHHDVIDRLSVSPALDSPSYKSWHIRDYLVG